MPAWQGCGMRHVTKITSMSPFATAVATKIGDKLRGAFWSAFCGQGCPIPECVRDMLGYLELKVPLDALVDGRVSSVSSRRWTGKIDERDIRYVEIALVFGMDLTLGPTEAQTALRSL